MCGLDIVIPNVIESRIEELIKLPFCKEFFVDYIFSAPIISRVHYEITWYDEEQDVAYAKVTSIGRSERNVCCRKAA